MTFLISPSDQTIVSCSRTPHPEHTWLQHLRQSLQRRPRQSPLPHKLRAAPSKWGSHWQTSRNLGPSIPQSLLQHLTEAFCLFCNVLNPQTTNKKSTEWMIRKKLETFNPRWIVAFKKSSPVKPQKNLRASTGVELSVFPGGQEANAALMNNPNRIVELCA